MRRACDAAAAVCVASKAGQARRRLLRARGSCRTPRRPRPRRLSRRLGREGAVAVACTVGTRRTRAGALEAPAARSKHLGGVWSLYRLRYCTHAPPSSSSSPRTSTPRSSSRQRPRSATRHSRKWVHRPGTRWARYRGQAMDLRVVAFSAAFGATPPAAGALWETAACPHRAWPAAGHALPPERRALPPQCRARPLQSQGAPRGPDCAAAMPACWGCTCALRRRRPVGRFERPKSKMGGLSGCVRAVGKAPNLFFFWREGGRHPDRGSLEVYRGSA